MEELSTIVPTSVVLINQTETLGPGIKSNAIQIKHKFYVKGSGRFHLSYELILNIFSLFPLVRWD